MDLEWIRERLVEKGMTQADLAARINLTPVQISKILSGSRQLKADEWERIRAALRVEDLDEQGLDPEKHKIIEHFDAMKPRQRAALIQFLELLVKDNDPTS